MATKLKTKHERLELLLQLLEQDDETEAAMWASPTKEQLAKINAWVPSQAKPLSESEVAVVTFVASDNFLDLNMIAWSLPGLLTMRDRYPGKPLILDHAWYSIEQSRAFVFDARLVKYSEAPDDINIAGYEAQNRQQMKRDKGYYQLELDCAFEADICTLKDLRFRRAAKVSTGTMISRPWDRSGYLCPSCNVEFEDETCPHLVPYPWMSTASRKLAAPYAIRLGLPYVVEISLCVSGQVPMAEII
jgi:hypothetical protein